MILSKQQILQNIQDKKILTSDYRPELINNQSIDVRLGRWLYIQQTGKYKAKYWHDLDTSPYNTKPDEFYIAHTEEFIGTAPHSNILPSFKLKSSAGRAGIIHTLAGHGDVGFCNRWAMEFVTPVQLQLSRYMAIGQIYFTQTTESGSYSQETGSYQSTEDFEKLQQEWSKDQILPKPLKIII